MNDKQKWIRMPGPGEMRGEGDWKRIEEVGCAEADWAWNVETKYLPTHQGPTPPEETQHG
jgi:hypothetical protein